MEKDYRVYFTAMRDSLVHKCTILTKLLEITKKQENLLDDPAFDLNDIEDEHMAVFEELLDTKEIYIKQVLDIDQGFQGIYDKVKPVLEEKKESYKTQILEMQDLIREATDTGVKIQALEQKNKHKLDALFLKKRQEIQEFRLNNRTAGAYDRHMTNLQQGESFYLDKRK